MIQTGNLKDDIYDLILFYPMTPCYDISEPLVFTGLRIKSIRTELGQDFIVCASQIARQYFVLIFNRIYLFPGF